MSAVTLEVLADAEQVSRAAAQEFVRIAREATAARGCFRVALSGGSTPRRLYQLLAEPPLRDEVEWPLIDFFWGDERAVPPDHPQSNFAMARAAFLARLEVPSARLHRMPAELPDREAAARQYQAEIARVFGVASDGEPPRFDLVLLGIGNDAHTASLFPHSPALAPSRRWVLPNEAPGLASARLTLTPAIINCAGAVVFLVAGADKAQAVAAALEGPADPQRLPVQLVRPRAGSVLWLLDEAAASGLATAATRFRVQ